LAPLDIVGAIILAYRAKKRVVCVASPRAQSERPINRNGSKQSLDQGALSVPILAATAYFNLGPTPREHATHTSEPPIQEPVNHVPANSLAYGPP